MTFKPGMHQNCETARVDFDAVIAKMAGAKPQVTFPMLGWGKKIFIKATVARKTGTKTEIEFYTEVTFPTAPANREIGYTVDDVEMFQGVQILEFEAQEEGAKIEQNTGEVLTYEDFVTRHITDSATRVTLERVMDHMKEMLAISDQSLERINDAWGNRDPGEGVLYSIPYQ